ncbi:hypothetical protein D3C77_636470 [compost metagenome]
MQVNLQVIAPAACLADVVRLAAGVVQTAADLARGVLAPIGEAAIDPTGWRELDTGFPAFVDRRRKVFVARWYFVGGRARTHLERSAPIGIDAGDLPG